MPFTFEKLHVYQKLVDFTDTICRLTERFPRDYGFLVDQLNRASLSIAPPSRCAPETRRTGTCGPRTTHLTRFERLGVERVNNDDNVLLAHETAFLRASSRSSWTAARTTNRSCPGTGRPNIHSTFASIGFGNGRSVRNGRDHVERLVGHIARGSCRRGNKSFDSVRFVFRSTG